MQSLSQYKRLVEKKFQRGLSEDWKHRDYIYLSDEIYDCSKIRVSPDTLKRIYGKKRTNGDYQPQTETLNALDSYVKGLEPVTIKRPDFFKTRLFFFVTGVLATCLILFVFLSVKGLMSDSKDIQPEVSVKLKTPITSIPVTANFELSLPEQFEFYTLHFGNGQSTNLKPGDTRYSHYYRSPGVYRVQVKNNGKPVSNIEQIYLPSIGWHVISELSDGKSLSFGDTLVNFKKEFFNTLDITSSDIFVERKRINRIKLCNYQPFVETEKSFKLSFDLANIKNHKAIDIDCGKVGIRLVGEYNNIFQSFSPVGCSYWLVCNYAGNYILGKRMDLSMFELDLKDWTNFRFEIEDQEMNIFVNNEKLHSAKLRKKVGQILGLEFSFKGVGKLDNIKMENSIGDLVFEEAFSPKSNDYLDQKIIDQ